VRRAPGILVVAPRVSSWLDGDKTVRALSVRQQPSAAREIWIEWRGMSIEVMVIAPGGVCLPQLDQRAANWMATIVDNFPAYDDAFAEWFACMLSRQIGISRADGIVAKNGAE